MLLSILFCYLLVIYLWIYLLVEHKNLPWLQLSVHRPFSFLCLWKPWSLLQRFHIFMQCRIFRPWPCHRIFHLQSQKGSSVYLSHFPQERNSASKVTSKSLFLHWSKHPSSKGVFEAVSGCWDQNKLWGFKMNREASNAPRMLRDVLYQLLYMCCSLCKILWLLSVIICIYTYYLRAYLSYPKCF